MNLWYTYKLVQFYFLFQNNTLRVVRGKMQYKKLANEYINEALTLKNYISLLKKNHAKEIALNERNICKRVSILCDIYLDLRCTGNLLKMRCEGENHGQIHQI